MARGGKREGAGRKPGKAAVTKAAAALVSANAATRELIPHIEEEVMRLTPIDVMYLAMRVAVQEGDLKQAAYFATNVAPYTHSKMPTYNVTSKDDAEVSTLTLEELEAIIAQRGIIDARFE